MCESGVFNTYYTVVIEYCIIVYYVPYCLRDKVEKSSYKLTIQHTLCVIES